MSSITPVPNTPQAEVSSKTSGTKKAEPDIIISDTENIAPDAMPLLLLENIGAQELSILSRHDLVNGQSLSYRPIKNLSQLAQKFNPQNLIALQNPSNLYFENFPIKLESKTPDVGTGKFGEIVYIEDITNNLIINVSGIFEDEVVEVQILVTGDLLDDTIYTEV